MSEPSLQSQPPAAGFIPGIYNYCDSWCSRCAFSARCRVFQMRSAAERAEAAGEDAESAMKAVLEIDDTPPRPPMTASEQLEWEALMERVSTPLSPEQEAGITAAIDRQREWVDAHPLSAATREYAHDAHEVMEALERMPGADALAELARDTIRHFAFFISAKTHRALSGLADAAMNEDEGGTDEDDGRMYDANGSACVARRGISESREAWRTLSQIAASDDIASVMIRRLSELDAAFAAAFPGAATFRRPGFDRHE